MAGQTGIQWCDATFNPWWGCERVSPACAYCYADTFAKRLGLELWGAEGSNGEHGFRWFGDKHWHEPAKWATTLPAKLGRRPRVFCASMADVFEERDELHAPRRRLFALIAATPELDWLILTKRPDFAKGWLAGAGINLERDLPNVWLGTSIENSRWAWRADVLRETPAAIRFISAEPLLGSLVAPRRGHPLDLDQIDWLIVGGESGRNVRRFWLEHARELIRLCRDQGVAPFIKQLGANPREGTTSEGVPLALRDRKGGDITEWPGDLRVREFPNSAVFA